MISSKLKILVVTSGKGGVGKTTVSTNLAIKLADLGKKVLLLDGDFGLGNVCVSMGLDPQLGIEDVILGNSRLSDICLVGPGGVKILPCASANEDMLTLNQERMDRFFRELMFYAAEEDYLVIDTGAGIGRGVQLALEIAHDVVVIATPEPTALADAYGLIKTCHELNNNCKIHLVPNRCNSTLEAKGVENKMKLAVRKFLKRELIMPSFIRQSSEVQAVNRSQKILLKECPQSDAAQSITRLAYRLTGVDSNVGKSNFVEKMIDLIQ
tara:strand:+ start:1122 stop:1925 length:804 start_codon:yes stop_codon:yes gene_type:complete